MDCRILRQIMLKADGHLCCDDSAGYFINLGEVSAKPGWSIAQVFTGAVYGHVRRSFSENRVPWPGVCEGCDLFSRHAAPVDKLSSRLRILVEPTLACHLACPTCKRQMEASRRRGAWDLDPEIFAALLRSCARENIVVEEITFLGWGEPLLHPQFAALTHIARKFAPSAICEVTTTGNLAFHEGLIEADFDHLIISCDGVEQDSYKSFRKKGNIDTVFSFMRAASQQFRRRPRITWKYILFEHTDSDADITRAQHLTDEIGLDEILFIVTNSKWCSQRFSAVNLGDFPILTPRARIEPAAAMQKIALTGEIVAEHSELGHLDGGSLFIDRCVVTETGLLLLDGWVLARDGRYADAVELHLTDDTCHQQKPEARRHDVTDAMTNAEGPDCGFAFRVPLKVVEDEMQWRLSASFADERCDFRAQMRFSASN